MEIDLKADAEKWGNDWLEQWMKKMGTDAVSTTPPFEAFIRPRLVELIRMKKFSDDELKQWIESAHAVAKRSFAVIDNVLRGQQRVLEVDPAKMLALIEKPTSRPN
jgi:hypothetical protein